MIKRLADYYRSRKLVLIGYDFQSEGGAWRSIYRYFRYAEARGETVVLIDRRKQGTFRQLLAAICFSPRILFNGLGAFHRWEGLLSCLLRQDILLYLHDTAHMLETFSKQYPLKYRLFRIILKRNVLLCVSEQMQEYYQKEFGVDRSHVIREAVSPPASPDFEPEFRHIVMVGSIEERKGAKLFSEVAERAAQLGLPWKFHWIGALASRSVGPLSKDVRWWGWQDVSSAFIEKADLFFLSSVDDPLPLACLEAMALGRRCVVYRKTGIAEMLKGIQGCSVYEDYSVVGALNAIQQALSEEPDVASLARLIQKNASVPAFASKLEQIAFAK